MEALYFSFVIPVFNRPEEIHELLHSFLKLKGTAKFEVIIIEDGSTIDCKSIVASFESKIKLSYYLKKNSGPGDSRNYGMNRAKGNYFIILDSDCILPENYLEIVSENLSANYVDCYGGPDDAHESFSNLQKAINFSMTSFITTGGIRGGKNGAKNFQPRSFNMGLSKNAFEETGGFRSIHPGEDPDLSIRLNKLGYKTALFIDAYVYHKRRISWSKFYTQVHKFGMVRPILNQWHPESKRLIYWLPTLFSVGFAIAILLLMVEVEWFAVLYGLYFFIAFIIALITTKKFYIALLSIVAIFIQFIGYGYGFMISTFKLNWSRQSPEQQFPNLFFKHVK